jgi:hypothetical protein
VEASGEKIMKKWPIAMILLMTSCFARSTMMTRGNFENIQEGEPIAEVQKVVGDPYSVRKLGDGSEEYQYIERIDLGMETVEENRYYLIIKNGQVVSKRFNQETPPAYDEIYDGDPNDVELQ